MIKFIKFSVVGVLNTIITILFFNIFIYFNMNYLAANTLSYILGVINSYVLNTKWSFNSTYNVNKLKKFIGGNLFSLCINLLILRILVNNFGRNVVYGQIFATGISMLINFLISKIIVFK